jgi:uncharacterized protein YkwD
MRLNRTWACALAFGCFGCGGGAAQSNGAKVGEALAFAAVAGAAQVAQSAIAENARNAPPRAVPCGDDGQYTCYYSGAIPPSSNDAREPVADMTAAEARVYTLKYINGVRRLNGVGPLVLDADLTAFAQAGSVQLSEDHRIHQHIVDHGSELGTACAENQGDPNGWHPAQLEDQIAEILGGMMREGPGGGHHDNILRPEWRRLGVGIVNPGQRMYFTTDFAM